MGVEKIAGAGKVIHKDEMRLISIKAFDTNILRVQCPSTKAYYFLRVPKDSKNCEEARQWTFGVVRITVNDYSEAYRQGELIFFRLKPKARLNIWKAPKEVPSGVIRVGEKEGHEHKLKGNSQLSMFMDTMSNLSGEKGQPAEGMIKVGEEGAEVTHPEHKPLKLPKGEYVVKTQKEATGKNTHQSVKD